MGQKGSLKDRIRFWRMQQKRKKEQKKIREEQELKKYLQEKENQGVYIKPVTKKYNVLQVFLHSFLGLFLSLFEPKKKLKDENILEKIDQEIKTLEKASTQDELHTCYQNLLQQEKVVKNKIEVQKRKNVPMTKTLETCIQKIESVKQKYPSLNVSAKEERIEKKQNLDRKMDNQELARKQEMIHTLLEPIKEEKIEKKQDSDRKTDDRELARKQEMIHTLLEPQMGVKERRVLPTESKEGSKVIIPSNEEIHLQNEKPKKVADEIVSEKEEIELEEEMLNTGEEQIDKYKKYLMDTNKKLKKQKEKLQEIKEKIKKAKTPKELYQIESSVLWIANQLYLMEKEYKEITKDKEFQYLKDQVEYYTLDKNDLLKNSKAITLLQEECQVLTQNIDTFAKEKEHRKQTKKQEEKEKQKEEKKPEYYLDVRDFEQLRLQVLGDLNQQIGEIKEIQLAPITKQPTGFFGKLSRFISTTALCLTPLAFFKNKLAGMLTSSILAHNRIRSMRQLIEGKEAIYETGQNLITDIKNKQDCLATIQNHLTDSYLELQQIKQSLVTKYQSLYPTEIENLFVQFAVLENEILAKTQSLQMNQNKLIQIRQKYQKVLKKE